MKKFLLLSIGALLSAGAVNADAKISLPGFPKEKSHKESKVSTLRNAFGVSKIRPVNAPVRMTIDTKENETVDKSVLSSYKMTTTNSNNEIENIEQFSYTYDEYGFPKTETDKDGVVKTFEYQWREPGRIWSSRTVTANGETYSTVRTFHPNGMVATQKQGDTFSRFDENGYLIEITSGEGEYSQSSKYVYFPLTKDWYESSYENNFKREFTIDGNSVTLTEMQKMSDGKWFYTRIYTDYYNSEGLYTGHLEKQYNCNEGEENTVNYASGFRAVKYTENGKIIDKTEEYDQDMDAWECSHMTVVSENYDNPYIYKPGEIRTYEYYYDVNGDGIIDSSDLRDKRVITWVNDRILKIDNTDYYETEDHYTEYALVSEDGTDYDEVYYNTSNGSYCVTDWEEESDAEYYTYYDANHNVLEVFRALEHENAPDTWEKKNGNTWEKCTGSITIDEGNNDRYVISFDNQSRVVRIEEWEYGVLDDYAIYTYDANGMGWTCLEYSLRDNGTQPALEIKSGETGYRTLADGSIEEWYIDYEDGIMISGYKTITKTNGAIQNYNYENGEWKFSGWAVKNKETQLADGFTETIEYEIDGLGNISNFRKVIRKNINEEEYEYSYYQVYNWDGQNSKWVGERFEIVTHHINLDSTYESFSWSNTDNNWYPESKRVETASIFPDIDYIEPVDPLAANDEYFFETPKYPYSDPIMTVHKMYQWDPESNELKLYEAYGEEYKKISDSEVQITNYDDYRNGGIRLFSLKVDNKRRLIEFRNNTWAYNDKNQVTRKVVVGYDGMFTNLFEFTYTDIKVWSGIDEIAGDDATVIATYNLAGVAVDADNLSAGIYIQKLSNGSSRKIVVK